jgi:carbonic anhydrase/acetyltransferase-like protein (isoleucine patch superfamily)
MARRKTGSEDEAVTAPFEAGVSSRGEGNAVDLAPDCVIGGRIEVIGRRNRLTAAPGAILERYAPAGFGATVPDIGKRSDASILIEGDDNVVEIAEGTRLGMNIVVRGNGNRIVIGRDAWLHGFANLITDGATLKVGSRTTMVQGSLQLHEPLTLSIGEDCMISSQVYVSVSDIHPIHDRATGARINAGRSVEIGDHVWLGLRTMVMKGSRIGPGAITAAGSIVSGEVPAHCIAGGAPARVMRREVTWSRELDPDAPLVVEAAPRRGWRLFGR